MKIYPLIGDGEDDDDDDDDKADDKIDMFIFPLVDDDKDEEDDNVDMFIFPLIQSIQTVTPARSPKAEVKLQH